MQNMSNQLHDPSDLGDPYVLCKFMAWPQRRLSLDDDSRSGASELNQTYLLLFYISFSEQTHPYALVVSFCNYNTHLTVISSAKSFRALRA